MERRCKSQQQQIFELKQELTNNTAELKLRLAQTEGNANSQNTYERMYFFFFTCSPTEITCMSPSDRPSGNREAKVQAGSGGHGQSTPEGGTSLKMKKSGVRRKYTYQTTVAAPHLCLRLHATLTATIITHLESLSKLSLHCG